MKFTTEAIKNVVSLRVPTGQSNDISTKILAIFFLIMAAGCASRTGNVGQVQVYPTPKIEAEWIRSGQPIDFEDELWFPMDDVETLRDTEVTLVGKFQDVQIFIEKTDVRPFDRLYTKFDVNKYRFYERNNN